MDDAKVYEKETWYVVMAFTENGLRYLALDGSFSTDVRNAAKWKNESQASDAAVKILTEHRCPAMTKKLTIEWSVNNVHESVGETAGNM